MNNVKHIGFHPLIKVKIAPAADLPEAGDARLHVEVAAVLLEDLCNIKPFAKNYFNSRYLKSSYSPNKNY
jgi:hypothetical protein